jgi:hypothetical protein
MDIDIDISAQRTGKDLAHAVDLARDIDDLRIDRPLPRERQQVTGQRGAAFYGLPHAGDDALALHGLRRTLQQLDAAREHGKKIVEVVRHATGELAERFQLLRAP